MEYRSSMMFLDTSFFIALFRKKDEDHLRAAQIFDTIRKTNEELITTTVVLAETLTLLKRVEGPENTAQVSDDLVHSNILISDIIEVILDSVEIFNKYEQFSLCDASNIAFMQKSNIKKIVSFDSDFDLVPGIERIY